MIIIATKIKTKINFSFESKPVDFDCGLGLPVKTENGLDSEVHLRPSQYRSDGLPSGSGYQPGGTSLSDTPTSFLKSSVY